MGKDARGIERAECRRDDCDCTEYEQSGPTNFACGYCGHYPSEHRNATLEQPATAKRPADQPQSSLPPAANPRTEPVVQNPYAQQPQHHLSNQPLVPKKLPPLPHPQKVVFAEDNAQDDEDDPFAEAPDPLGMPPLGHSHGFAAQPEDLVFSNEQEHNAPPEAAAPQSAGLEDGGWPAGTKATIKSVVDDISEAVLVQTMKSVPPSAGIDELVAHCFGAAEPEHKPQPKEEPKDWPPDIVDRLAEALPEDFPRERIEKVVASFQPRGNVDEVLAFLFSETDSVPSYECQLCMCEYKVDQMYTVNCPSSHRFCFECIQRMVEIAIRENTPCRCPGPDCTHTMDEYELRQIMEGAGPHALITKEMIEKYAQQVLIRCVRSIPGIIACPTPGCKNWIEPSDMTRKERCQCAACGAVFCSLCKGPYHYRCSCGEVRKHQERWLEWMTSGRERYNRDKADAINKIRQAREQLDKKNAELMQRYKDMMADEEYKRANGRYCPKCHRVIIKDGGCDLMVCGRNYHGGNVQDGCGAHFNWSQAEPYHSETLRRPDQEELKIDIPEIAREYVHTGIVCDICHEEIKFVQHTKHTQHTAHAPRCFLLDVVMCFLPRRRNVQGTEVQLPELPVDRLLREVRDGGHHGARPQPHLRDHRQGVKLEQLAAAPVERSPPPHHTNADNSNNKKKAAHTPHDHVRGAILVIAWPLCYSLRRGRCR